MLLLRRILPVCLLLLFGWMAWSVSPKTGVTFDETAHLTAGWIYWKTGDYRFQPENGNFPQRWAALPLSLQADRPDTTASAWHNADVWALGRQLFFDSGHDTARLLSQGRIMIVLLGIALLACIWAWARSLFGSTGGLIALGFAVFSPTLLAHSGLITSDIAAALGFMLAITAWWRLCHRLNASRLIFAGLSAGLLALCKFSAALLAPVLVFMLVIRLAQNTPLPWACRQRRGWLRGWARLPALFGAGITAALLAIVVIWSAYGFRYSATTTQTNRFAEPWDIVLMQAAPPASAFNNGTPAIRHQPGVVQQFVSFARDHTLLPEAFLYGLAFTDYHARGRLAYFAGDYRTEGWRSFFPTAFVLKTTLPVLLAFALGIAGFATTDKRKRARWLYRLSPLLVFFVIYWVFAIFSSLNIGHRHLLPIYPLIFVLLGTLGSLEPRRGRRLMFGLSLILLGWQVVESARVRPHYLTYFNALAGGPVGGHRYFVDSSLDWGQGLPDLKAWLEANRRDEAVYLSYFGSDEPARFSLHATRIGDVFFDHSQRPALPSLGPGIYCISATMLHRVYTLVRGPWSEIYERRYWDLFHAITNPATPAATTPAAWEEFEQLRFGRLCHFLEMRRPDAIVGNVFFIYRLDDAELTVALSAPLPEGKR